MLEVIENGGEIIRNTQEGMTAILEKESDLNSLAEIQYEIATHDQAEYANELLKTIKSEYNFLESKRKEIKSPFLKASQDIDSFFKGFTEKLSRAESYLKKGLLEYHQEQTRKQKEEEARAIEEAKKLEEAEKKRLEDRAKKLQTKGKIEQAEVLFEQAQSVFVPTVLTSNAPPKLKGTSIKKQTIAIIEDVTLIPPSMYLSSPKVIEAIQSVMDSYAKVKVPIAGVRYEEKESISTRVA